MIEDTLLYTVPFPPIPILRSVPGLTKIKVDRALRGAILGISMGVTHSEIFCTTMTRDDKAAIKVDAARPRSRPCSCSATKSRPKSGPITCAATPTSILEVLNSKKDKAKNNPAVVAMEETFASIASRPPSPKATKFSVTEAARAAATGELEAAISKHRADF
jgi:hypothetical protein